MSSPDRKEKEEMDVDQETSDQPMNDNNNNNNNNKMEVDENENENENENEDNVETSEERRSRAMELKKKGNEKYSKGRYTEAINFYSEAIECDHRPEFYSNRAAAYMQINKFQKALNDCLTATHMNPEYKKAYVRAIKCYTHLGLFKEGRKFAQSGIDHFPNDKELNNTLSRLEITTQKIERIESKLNKVSLKYNSMYEHLLNNNNNNNKSKDEDIEMTDNNEQKEEKKNDETLNSHKIKKEDLREINIALNIINDLLSTELSNSQTLKCMNVKALIIKQDYNAALSVATNFLRLNADYIPALKLRSIALFKNGNTDGAIKHLQSVLRKDPDNKECRTLFKIFKSIVKLKTNGNDLFKNGKLNDAINIYTECILKDPTNFGFNSVIYANRAAVWLKKKEYENAYNDCCLSIDMDPSYMKAYCRRYQALLGLERYDEALADATKAYEMEPNNAQLKQQLREAKIELKKSKRKNYYKILGVSKDATDSEIKKGFRKMAMKWHPDKFASASEKEQKAAEEKFKEIGEAYEVLKDPKMKKRYDAGADLDEIKQGMSSHFPGGHVDISQIFDLLGGMGGMGGMPGGFSHGGGGNSFTFRFG